MKRLWLIRHGETDGNSRKKYIGITDEPLNDTGRRQAAALCAIEADEVFTSPLMRCIETAQLAFPNMQHKICAGLAECNFGIFEGKSADEMASLPAYRHWVDTGCLEAIPGGESVSGFKERCCAAFLEALGSSSARCPAFVIHGGCIMAIMERLEGSRSFYDYHIDNGGAVLCEYDDQGRLRILGGFPW